MTRFATFATFATLSRFAGFAVAAVLIAAVAVRAADLKAVGYDPKRDPAKDLSALVVQATRANRHILLEVGGEWCSWCHTLQSFIDNDRELKALWDGKYLTLKVNYSPENENRAFLSRYPKVAGYPHLFVLDKTGKLLHSQDTALLESGKSYSRERMKAFLLKWG
jgi:thioredoxin-related protein